MGGLTMILALKIIYSALSIAAMIGELYSTYDSPEEKAGVVLLIAIVNALVWRYV